MEPLVEFRGATLAYRAGRAVVSDVSLAIQRGEFLGLVGPNGSGKTTFLNALLGLLAPAKGTIERNTQRIGYLPQRNSLDPLFPLEARDVVAMGLYDRVGLLRRLSREDWRAVDAALENTGMRAQAGELFRAMSGGQKQRVLIARALVGDADMLVLDEPTSGLDLTARQSVLDCVERLHGEMGLTILFVSHTLDDLTPFVTRLALFQKGHVVVGQPRVLLNKEVLTELYGHPMQVEVVRGIPRVFPEV
jgi:zinc transport system ATP-binding protein